jgi:hypothetical protein
MTCDDCERWQASGWVFYYRHGTANVGIVACEKHATEVINVLREHDGLEPFGGKS